MRTIEEIENERVAKQKELNKANEYWTTLEDEKLNIQMEIINLQGKKKEIEITLNKGRQVIKTLKTDIAILTNEFWSTKNS